jgi:O-antigen/teichoic acid export membrane protein
LSVRDLKGFHQVQNRGVASVRLTLITIAHLRRSLGASNLTELLLFGSLPALSVLGALVSLAVPRVLGPVLFGQYSLVEALCRYGVGFDLGLSVLADRRLSQLLATAGEADQSAFASTVLWLRLYIFGAALSVGALLLPVLSLVGALPFEWPLGAIALTAGMLGMLVNGPTSIERARSHRRRFAIFYAGGLSVLSFGRLFGVMAGGVMGCFAAMGVCYGALAIYSHRDMFRPHTQPDARSVRTMFHESVPLFLTMYTYTLLVTANRWVVASQVDAESFGHFAFGSSVVTLLMGLVGGMTQLWYPRLAKLHASGDVGAVSRSVMRDLAALSIAMAFVATICVVVSPWLIGLAYPKFRISLNVIQLILACLPAATIAAWLLPLGLATGARPWVDGVLLYAGALAFLVVTTEVGVRMGGIRGASWGLVVSMPTLVGLQLWRLCSRRVVRRLEPLLLFIVVLLTTVVPALVAVTVE